MPDKRGQDKQGGHRSPTGASQASPSPAQANSSRASSVSPGEQTKAQIDFQFLNFSHPAQAKTGKTLKAIRSHVTRQQHQRENAAAAARRVLHRQNTAESQTSLSASPAESPSTSVPAQSSNSDVSPFPNTSPDASPVSPSPGLSPTPSNPKPLDPIDAYPEEWHAYIPRILEHYFNILAVDNPYLDGPNTTGLLRTQFFPFMLTDLASLHAVMLFGASHYGRSRNSKSHTIDLLQLRGMAIREINVALEDGVRATSDQVIAAVGKLAAYEAIFGDANIFHTHMIGLLRIVSLRGGLPALGLDGLLERMLLWIDSNAAQYMRTHIYFDKAAFPSQYLHPASDIAAFTGGLSGR